MNEVTPPFPPLAESWPWLAGQGGALLLVAVVGLLVLRGDDAGRRRGALGWGLAATAMPVAWLVARWVPGLVDGAVPLRVGVGGAVGLGIHGLVAWAAVYLSDLAAAIDKAPRRRPPSASASTSPPLSTSPPPAPPSSQPSRGEAPRGSSPASPPQGSPPAPVSPSPAEGAAEASPAPSSTKALIKPPAGATVAAALPEADGLLRVLAEGTAMQQAAAAKALSLSFGDTGSKAVMHGLLDVVLDEDADEDVRVEAWVAACQVVGDPLPWEVESKLRMEGPSGIDPAQVMAWAGRID